MSISQGTGILFERATMAVTVLEKPLHDLRRELADLRQKDLSRDYDTNKLSTIITRSKDSLREAGVSQQQLLQQLQQFDISLADINALLRASSDRKAQLDQQQQSDSGVEVRAKLMELNAEALECRAAAVQLQQEAQVALAKTAELERRAQEELARQELERKLKEEEAETIRAAEQEHRLRLEEEQRRLKELEIQQQKQEQERLLAATRAQAPKEDDYSTYTTRDFMNDDQCPQCLVRLPPTARSTTLQITFLNVAETENLLDNQEELVSTPIDVNLHPVIDDQQPILFSIPYIVKRSVHRENVIKVRQANGIWLSTETTESTFESYKEKRFMECKLTQSSAYAVVSRLKLDTVLVDKQSAGRFVSSADPRVTMQWPRNVCQTDLRLNVRVQPVDLPAFTNVVENNSHECQGLLAVGPIIDLDCDEVTLLKPMQFKLPILLSTKKTEGTLRSTETESGVPQRSNTSQLSQQEIILRQQQSIFKSMLGEESSNERLLLLYTGRNETIWHIDSNASLLDSKTRDTITINTSSLHSRMIIARCEKQLPTTKQLQTVVNLLEQSLGQRSVSLILRRRAAAPNEICFVCCSSQRTDTVDEALQEEKYIAEGEQSKELTMQEGELLELRFRGNVLPIDDRQQSYPFAFNTNFPFYHQTNVCQTDKYSQHFSPYFYGFVQIFSRQTVLRTVPKETDKKKQQSEVKQEWHEVDVCLAELPIRLPKPPEESRVSTPRASTPFSAEGILTTTLFRDVSASLQGDEWRSLARRLGMTRIRIEAIEHDHLAEAPYYMLLAWFKRAPRSTDKVSLLIAALNNISRWDLAQDLQTMHDEKRQAQQVTSKGDQSKSFRAPFNRICQRDECIRMWKQLARGLTLTNDDIARIEQKYPSKEEQCLRSLEHWASQDPHADIPSLARIIRSLGFKSLAREIDNMA